MKNIWNTVPKVGIFYSYSFEGRVGGARFFHAKLVPTISFSKCWTGKYPLQILNSAFLLCGNSSTEVPIKTFCFQFFFAFSALPFSLLGSISIFSISFCYQSLWNAKYAKINQKNPHILSAHHLHSETERRVCCMISETIAVFTQCRNLLNSRYLKSCLFLPMMEAVFRHSPQDRHSNPRNQARNVCACFFLLPHSC